MGGLSVVMNNGDFILRKAKYSKHKPFILLLVCWHMCWCCFRKEKCARDEKKCFLQARDCCEVIMILYKDRLIYLQGSEVRRKVDFQNNCIHFNASKYMDEFH